MINELKEMLQGAEREKVWEIYKIAKILTENEKGT